MDNNQLKNQGDSIRNSFNNNNINKNNNFNHTTNVNNFDGNHYGGYGGYGHYGGYGAGYAHGYANGAYHGGYWGYPGAWGCAGLSSAAMWTCMGITSLTSFLGMGMMAASSHGGGGGSSTSSNYSPTNITYQGDTVYVNGQPSGSTQEYYQQAQNLAAKAQGPSGGGEDPNEQWQALGVFSLAAPGQTQSDMLLQLAINQTGTVRGNYLNQLTNEKSQVFGSLDKQTQRISWTIGDNNQTVFDTSLADLTKDDSQILVHYGPTDTREMALIRMPAPSDGGSNQQGPTG
jgi:hypothetical protein